MGIDRIIAKALPAIFPKQIRNNEVEQQKPQTAQVGKGFEQITGDTVNFSATKENSSLPTVHSGDTLQRQHPENTVDSFYTSAENARTEDYQAFTESRLQETGINVGENGLVTTEGFSQLMALDPSMPRVQFMAERIGTYDGEEGLSVSDLSNMYASMDGDGDGNVTIPEEDVQLQNLNRDFVLNTAQEAGVSRSLQGDIRQHLADNSFGAVYGENNDRLYNLENIPSRAYESTARTVNSVNDSVSRLNEMVDSGELSQEQANGILNQQLTNMGNSGSVSNLQDVRIGDNGAVEATLVSADAYEVDPASIMQSSDRTKTDTTNPDALALEDERRSLLEGRRIDQDVRTYTIGQDGQSRISDVQFNNLGNVTFIPPEANINQQEEVNAVGDLRFKEESPLINHYGERIRELAQSEEVGNILNTATVEDIQNPERFEALIQNIHGLVSDTYGIDRSEVPVSISTEKPGSVWYDPYKEEIFYNNDYILDEYNYHVENGLSEQEALQATLRQAISTDVHETGHHMQNEWMLNFVNGEGTAPPVEDPSMIRDLFLNSDVNAYVNWNDATALYGWQGYGQLNTTEGMAMQLDNVFDE